MNPEAEASTELQASLDTTAGELGNIEQDELVERWPSVPEHAKQYVRTTSPENFSQVMDLVAELDPAELEDPEIASFLIDDCILEAQSNALVDATNQEQETGQQLDTEGQQLDTEGQQLDVEAEDLQQQINQMYQQVAQQGGGVDAVINNVLARLQEIEAGPAREAAEAKMVQVQASLDRMRSVVTNPQERQAFESILSTANLNLGATGDLAIFGDVLQRVESSSEISDATKDNIRRSLGVPDMDTGSDVDQVMNTVDPETGQPVYTRQNPLPVREGMTAYVEPDGTRRARVEVDGVGVREIEWEAGDTGETIGLKLSMLKIYAVNEHMGNTDFMGETVFIDTQVLSQTDPEKLRKTRQIMEAVFGGDAGYDGEVIANDQADYLAWFNQYISTKGDAAEGDYDRFTAVTNRTNLGIHPEGKPQDINYEVLRAAGSFAQAQYGSGNPDYYAMQRHLNGLFPHQVPLTGENAPEGDENA